jgi:hypothetical protein
MKEAYCADYKQAWLEASGAAAAAADALLRTERMRVVERGAPTTRSSSSAVVRSIRFRARPRPRLLRRTPELRMPTV